jgi:hypothetical protein
MYALTLVQGSLISSQVIILLIIKVNVRIRVLYRMADFKICEFK